MDRNKSNGPFIQLYSIIIKKGLILKLYKYRLGLILN